MKPEQIRPATEHSFASHDGEAIFYRRWSSITGRATRAVVLLHRGHEHSGRLQHLVDELEMPDTDVFAWDARGHGRSAGERGCAPDVGVLVKDVDCFVKHITAAHGIETRDVALVGQSVGAVLAAAWVHDYAPKVRCMVLAAPALRVRLYVPFAIPLLRALHAVKPDAKVTSYVKSKLLTRDPDRQASYDADPLVTRPIGVGLLLDLFDTATRLIDDAGAIVTPTQVLVPGSDWVVEQAPQRRFFDRLGAATKSFHELPGLLHDTFGDRDRHVPIGLARAFIERSFDEAPARASLGTADRAGYTKEELDRLSAPISVASPKSIGFALARLGLASAGRLSQGVRLGIETGFDSGSTLDYVYRNEASGTTPLGRLIDQAYLDSVGWRGIRQRKLHVERLLADAISHVRAQGLPVRFVDIAAGHGRYVLDALESIAHGGQGDVEVLLRDYREINVESGRRLIQARGLTGRVRFELGDAFDRGDLARLAPRPTVAIVSGLYELFPDNDRVRASLAGLAEAVAPGGCLVYTNQPWHPQLELIARVLTSHRDGAPWVMRRRTQAEMDELVEDAGFEKVEQRIDRWGIFSVSLAVRTRS